MHDALQLQRYARVSIPEQGPRVPGPEHARAKLRAKHSKIFRGIC
jgi:hypothetical protein